MRVASLGGAPRGNETQVEVLFSTTAWASYTPGQAVGQASEPCLVWLVADRVASEHGYSIVDMDPHRGDPSDRPDQDGCLARQGACPSRTQKGKGPGFRGPFLLLRLG